MNFDLTEEQRLLQQSARDFARREIEPRAAELDRSARWPAEIVGLLGEQGFLGLTVPAVLCGAGRDHVSLALLVEEISAACASSGAIAAAANALFCDPLLRFGTELQKREILAPTAAGRMLGTFALSDPRGASPTVGEKQADGSFLLNGRKSFVTAGPHAEHVIVLAMTTSDPDKPRHTALIVRRGEPGYSSAPPDEKMGLRAAHASTLVFENVRVPATHVLGGEGAGLDVAAFAIDGIRIGIAAQAVGIARAAFERAAAHAREGKANQATQFMISDMAVDIDAARLLALRAARLRDRSVPHTAESSMAKLFASEMATRVTHRAMQIFGGLGYTAGGGVERQYRDARITEIDEGTSEIQRNIIAAAVLER